MSHGIDGKKRRPDILRDLVLALLSTGQIVEEWKEFMELNEDVFRGNLGAEAKQAESKGEFTLAASDVHAEFVKLVEKQLESALEVSGCSLNEFSRACSEMSQSDEVADVVRCDHSECSVRICNQTSTPQFQAFCQLIVGATDFIVFGDIMRDAGKRSYYFQIIAMWRKELSSVQSKK